MEASKSERAALPRDFTEFLVELSVALHRHGMYPAGHPSLGPAVETVTRRAERLLQDRAVIAVGVTRRQLLVDDAATDPDQPVLRRLAEALHKHHIGALSVTPGVRASEFAGALRELSADAERDGPMDLRPQAQTRWPHLKFHPLAFDGLVLAGDESASEEPSDGGAGSRGRDLWAELARVAVFVEGSPDQGDPQAPETVAAAINQHAPDERFDRAIMGFLLEIAHELATAPPDQVSDLQHRVRSLLSSLESDTLRRLVRMGGNAEQQGRFVSDVTRGVSVDTVLDIVQAASGGEHQTISHGLLRMLSKLALHAQKGTDLARPHADREFREQVLQLLADWRLRDPNPTPYGRALERLATSTSEAPTLEQAHESTTALRLVQMSLESGRFAPMAERAIDELIGRGQLSGLFELLVSPPPGAASVADEILTRLTRPETLKAMLEQDRVDLAGLDALLPRLSQESYGPLLDAMGSSPNRAVRRRLLDRLAQTTVDIGPLVLARLEDERWFVQRNMLVLLERSARVPDGFSPARWTKHADARVRIEAIRLQLASPQERDTGIRAALGDADPRIVRLGLAAVQQRCPRDLVSRVIALSSDATLDPDVRVMAVTAIGRVRDESALEALLRLTDGGRTLFGRLRLPPKTSVLVAALRGLHATWAADPRAARVLAIAARSSDSELRDAAMTSSTV